MTASGTDAGWNFADLWETVTAQIPDALAQQQGARTFTWAEFNRRANGIASVLLRTGLRRAGQGRPVPLQRPRVPGVDLRRVQGRLRRRQHQLPVRRRRTRLPVGQRRRHRRGVPRCIRRAVRSRARSGPEGAHLAVGRRRHRTVPRLGDAVRSRCRRGHRRQRRGRGGAAATTCCCSTPAAPPACPRA